MQIQTTIKNRGDMGSAPLGDASARMWRQRPGDVLFHDPRSFADAMRAIRERSAEVRADLSTLRAVADGDEIQIIGRTGQRAIPSHWAFGQLAQRAHAPAGFLRELPAAMAADVLTDRLQARGAEGGAAGLLFRKTDDGLELHAATGADYGRIWHADCAIAAAEAGDRAGFSAPVAFKSAGRDAGLTGPTPMGDQHGLPCAVAGDRDAFLFLVDYEAQIRVPGYDAPLFRGFFLSNSETGGGSLALTTFLLDGVCCNLNVWGAKEVTEIRLRHTSGIGKRSHDLYALARDFAQSSAADDEARIASAQRTLVADTSEKVIDRLFGMRLPGVTRTVAEAAVEVAKTTPRYGDPRSAWAVGNGLTEVSQRETYAGDRAQIDRAAGRVFRMAAF